MHRAFCRVFRGSCRKWRESEAPVVHNSDDAKNGKNHDFVPPKHTWNEALGWTTTGLGIVLAWQVTHRRCGYGDENPTRRATGFLHNCPFSLTTKAVTQPLFSTTSHVVRQKRRGQNNLGKTSIDSTPFLRENLSLSMLLDASVPFNANHRIKEIDDECDIVFEEEKPTIELNALKEAFSLNSTRTDNQVARKEEVNAVDKLTADLYSVLGAFTFLRKYPMQDSNVNTAPPAAIDSQSPPPINAMELLSKGAELGSARALYNIGVAYDRMKEPTVAQEYYRRASDLGHPLATYNSSVFAFREGKLAEGLTLMKVAAGKGVPEAKKALRDNSV